MTLTNSNLKALYQELEWLSQVLDVSFAAHFQQDPKNWQELSPPPVDQTSSYGSFVIRYELDNYSRLALALSLAPNLKPQTLDLFFVRNKNLDRSFTEFGGKWNSQGGFLPTLQTLLFIITANDPMLFLKGYELLSPDHVLQQNEVINFSETEKHEAKINAQFNLNPHWFDHFVTGKPLAHSLNHQFGEVLTTPLSWHDLVVDPLTQAALHEITTWCQHQHTILKDWDLQQKLKPGYRALFYGPTGTGKTLSAALLGKELNKTVYRIDTTSLVSKYIGETEKNLAQLFKTASQRDWILYFDEADTLFSKPLNAQSANDHHVNAINASVLKQLSDFAGLAILATERKTNIDPRFYPLLQNSIYFPPPNAQQRLQLWQNAFNGTPQLASEINLNTIAENHELTAASILNVLRYCAITAIRKNSNTVSLQDLMEGITREKQG